MMLFSFNAFTLGFGSTPTKPVDQRPSVADLPACDSKPAHQFNYLRTFQTPRELLDGGKFTALRPRTDWITLHDFTFPESPPGQAHAAVYVEMGAVGGSLANMNMCLANDAPGGCPDLRNAPGLQTAFGLAPGVVPTSTAIQGAVAYWKQNVVTNPICNIVGVKHGPVRLDILDLCLDTEKSDENYYYMKAMMDFQLTGDCQGAPPSCRLVKMGKPDGNDPTYWEESWDTWGALAYNTTHLTRASWAICPADMDDQNRVPCNFGALQSSTNCDGQFAPNIAPPKRNPPEPWLPNGFQGHPTGPSVIAHFCGDGCEWDGRVPALPTKSAHAGDGRQTLGTGAYPGCPAGCRVAGPRE
mgnify:FL=1